MDMGVVFMGDYITEEIMVSDTITRSIPLRTIAQGLHDLLIISATTEVLLLETREVSLSKIPMEILFNLVAGLNVMAMAHG